MLAKARKAVAQEQHEIYLVIDFFKGLNAIVALVLKSF
jgi:hypothetical protein